MNTQTEIDIWLRSEMPNYFLLETDSVDFELGYEIQSPEKQFISWDITYLDLVANPSVEIKINKYKTKSITFKYPVRIGNILLMNFCAYFDNHRLDVAVLHYYANCYDNNCTDYSYKELHQEFERDLYRKSNETGYSREEQKKVQFQINGMQWTICYTYASKYFIESGYTSFSIVNKREYPNLLVDAEYEEKISIHNYLTLMGNILVNNNYKENPKIKRRPLKLIELFNIETLIWMDEVNQKIGFACNQYSVVYDVSEIKYFSIENTLPALGEGMATLDIHFYSTPNNYSIFTEECHFFDAYAEKIAFLTGKEVIFSPESYDA